MSTEKDDFAKNLEKIIKNNSIAIKKITGKEIISVEDQKIMDAIKIETQEILSNTKVVKNLPVNAIKELNDVKSRLLDNHSVAFSYTPVDNKGSISSRNQSVIPENSLVVKHDSVIDGNAIGSTKTTLGIVDDFSEYSGKPTIFIGKSKSGNPEICDATLHDIKIDDEYKISFDFKLNRFPSKVYRDIKHYKYSDSPAMIAKRYTSRRSDLISFNYGEEGTQNTIRFGVMAPHSINLNGSNEFDNHYDDFSIAACINYNTNEKLSVFTDYKFKLGETYNVTLKIKLITADYLTGLEEALTHFIKSNKLSKFPEEIFFYDGLEYGEKSANIQLKRWAKILYLSDHEYDQKLGALEEIKKIYETAFSQGLEKFKNLQGTGNYTLESGRKKIMELDEFLDNKDTFGARGAYDISITINGVRENILTTNNKVWGSSAKIQKIEGNLASGPGFSTLDSRTISEKNTDYGVTVNKFPKYIDDIINSEINRRIRLAKRGVDIKDMQWYAIISSELEKNEKYKKYLTSFQNIENSIGYDDISSIINTYGDSIKYNRSSSTPSPLGWAHSLNIDLSIEGAYVIMKRLKKLGVVSKIIDKSKMSPYYDPRDLYEVDVRLINYAGPKDPMMGWMTTQQIKQTYSRYANIDQDTDRKLDQLYLSPFTFIMNLSVNEAMQFKGEMEGNGLVGVVLKPKLIAGSPKTKFTNKLPPYKVCVPIYSELSNKINGILPHHVIIDKPRFGPRKVAQDVPQEAAQKATRKATVSEDASLPQQSQSVSFDKLDLTKLYSIYSTPYIIKKQ